MLSCSKDKFSADVIIYGGTSAAVISAVETVQSGKNVIIVCPDKHLGGLTSGGLGFTDSGNTGSIGGLSREFYHRVWLHYNDLAAWKWQKQSEYGNKGQGTMAMDGESRTMWIFEPHVAEKIFEDFIRENNIPVYRDEWLDRDAGVEVDNNRIVSMTTLSGKKFRGKMFIDATYEGDLMAAAGYELLARVFESGWNEWFAKYDIIPNRKSDTNNHGPFSSDHIGMNYDYPEASYERRKEIIEDHTNYQKGLLYFVSTDERVPQEVRERMKEWGLAGDEFTDNDNWPHQLYIREARRMVGAYVTTENEVLGKVDVPDPVGMGSYTMDSHNVQRFVTAEGYVQNEGDVGVHPGKPYKIAYGSIVPRKGECGNLLVPVCLSSSHIAFGSIRMEPVFMILGQSAAAAAVIAIDNKIDVQDVSYEQLEKVLTSKGQILKK